MELVEDKELRNKVLEFMESFRGETNINILNLEEFEELINERRNESNNEVKKELKTELSIAYLYSMVYASLSLAINQGNGNSLKLSQEWSEEVEGTPLLTLQNCFTNISNHILSIIRLVEDGFDLSARIILRVLIELSWIVILVSSDLEIMKIYHNSEDEDMERRAWYKFFKPKKLLEGVTKIETQLGIDNEEMLVRLNTSRSETYNFYSKTIHNSYLSSVVGAYSTSFDEEGPLNLSLFGMASKGSKGTMSCFLEMMFYLTLMINTILKKIHNHTPAKENELWNTYDVLQKCSQSTYFYYLKKEEK
ncbi:hypothetical protein [Domibacillus tundrae]|uniref:hypothetical protein n=1 Tax=Domibacillus tundrae TaxID=1587527 RepID=UPI000617B22D|nr:hypothetical protein [Domibacillus tundrae]